MLSLLPILCSCNWSFQLYSSLKASKQRGAIFASSLVCQHKAYTTEDFYLLEENLGNRWNLYNSALFRPFLPYSENHSGAVPYDFLVHLYNIQS